MKLIHTSSYFSCVRGGGCISWSFCWQHGTRWHFLSSLLCLFASLPLCESCTYLFTWNVYFSAVGSICGSVEKMVLSDRINNRYMLQASLRRYSKYLGSKINSYKNISYCIMKQGTCVRRPGCWFCSTAATAFSSVPAVKATLSRCSFVLRQQVGFEIRN